MKRQKKASIFRLPWYKQQACDCKPNIVVQKRVLPHEMCDRLSLDNFFPPL